MTKSYHNATIPAVPQPMESRVVPVELLREAAVWMANEAYVRDGSLWDDLRKSLESILDRPAAPVTAQEPAAWLYSDPDGLAKPITCTERASEEDKGGWDESPLYTHADAGEYLTEIAEALSDETLNSMAHVATGIRDLRTQLAERDALRPKLLSLLTRLLDHPHTFRREICNSEEICELINALSASAEPSAPVDERAEFEEFRDNRNAALEMEGHKPGSKWHVTQAHYATWQARAKLSGGAK